MLDVRRGRAAHELPARSSSSAASHRDAAAMAAPLSEENKLAQDLLLQMKDYTPTVRRLAASPSHPQPLLLRIQPLLPPKRSQPRCPSLHNRYRTR